MGSSSVGAQGLSFGMSLGTTWQDNNCRRLKNSRELAAMGYSRAATALLCVDDDVRDAMLTADTPCPGDQNAASEGAGESKSAPLARDAAASRDRRRAARETQRSR
jgi:hypothetical protein